MLNKSYKIHSVKYNLIMNVILKMSSFIFPLITFPYVSRVLGATANGKVAFATSVIYYFTVIATLGIPTYGIKVCANYRDDIEKLSKIVKELLIICSIMMIISYAIFFIALNTFPQLYEEKILMLINSITILLTVIGVEWFYQAIEQYDYITIRNLVFKIISIILMFAFVHESKDYVLYGAITILGTTGSNVLNILRLNKFVHLNKKYHLEFKMHIKPIFVLFMLTAATMIYTSLDTTMLGFISGDTQVGYYNAAIKIKNILVSLVTALGTVLLPRLSYYITNGMQNKFNNLIKKSFNFVFLISVPLTFYCILMASDCINFLAGNGYSGSIVPMQLITPTIIFIGLTNIIGIQILVPLGFEKKTVISTIIGAVVNLILNYILIPLYASSGAAFATMVAELLVLITQLIMIRYKIKELIDLKNFIKIFISGVFSFMVLVAFNSFTSIGNSFFNLVATAVVYFSVYGLLVLVLKEKTINDIFKQFISKINLK